MKKYLLAFIFLLCLPIDAYATCSGTTLGTPATANFLVTNDFQNGRPPGSITPDCLRDLVASGAGNATNVTNLKNLGLPTGGDDTSAINTAITNAVAAGQAIYAPAGTYKHASTITLNGGTLFGDGITTIFQSTDGTGTAQAIELDGTNPSIHDIQTTTTWTGARQSSQDSHAITNFQTTGAVIRNVFVNGSAAGGIFNYGVTRAQVFGNTVQNTLADGIHVTHQSDSVLVEGNIVLNSGDDCFPVVSYAGELPVKNVTTVGNTCSNSKARGLVVEGGEFITFVGNTIYNTTAAGIFVGADTGQLSTSDVQITGNHCILCSMQDFDHPQLFIASPGSGLTVSNINVTGNKFSQTNNHCIEVGSGAAASGILQVNITGNNCVAIGSTTLIATGTVAGTTGAGKTLTLTFTGGNIQSSPQSATYNSVAGDTADTEASHLADAVNANLNLTQSGVSAVASVAGQGTCTTSTCIIEVHGLPSAGAYTLTKTVAGGATITLATGLTNNGDGIFLNGVTNPVVTSNNITGPFIFSGIENNHTAGAVIISNNLLDGVNTGGGSNAPIFFDSGNGATRAVVTGNVQVNDGVTPATCMTIQSVANAIVQGNDCEFDTSTISGVTSGRVDYPSNAGFTQSFATTGQTFLHNYRDETTITITAGAGTGMIMTAGTYTGQAIQVVNAVASVATITFAAVGTSHVQGGTGVTIPAGTSIRLTWDVTGGVWIK